MDWNWEAVSAISSVIGGICVLISVAFLVYEVRRNAQAIEGSTVQSLMSLERDVFAMLADHAELFTSGSHDRSSLSDEGRFRFDRLVNSYVSLVYSGFVQRQQGLMDDEVWDAYLNAVSRYLKLRGFADSWNVLKTGYPLSFQDEMTRLDVIAS